MVTVNAIIIESFGHPRPQVKVVSRGGADFYKTLVWPVGKPLTPGTIKVEVAKQWKVAPPEVVILDNVEVPKIKYG